MNKVNQELLQETQSGWYHLQVIVEMQQVNPSVRLWV